MRNFTTVRYHTWRKAVRKYRRLRQRTQHESASSARLLHKLNRLQRRIIHMNRRWQIGIAAAILAAWLAAPIGVHAQDQDNVLRVDDIGGENGFVIADEGSPVSVLGDINGDGFDDVIAGNTVALGSSSGAAGSSFLLQGALRAASGTGDVNGDGIDDFIVSSSNNNESYVVFGSSDGFEGAIDLSALNDSTVVINGNDTTVTFNKAGFIVAGAGTNAVGGANDVNGDGLNDLIVASQIISSQEVYVIFSGADDFMRGVDVSSLNGSNGFVITRDPEANRFSRAVDGAGDVNGDGFGDVIIGSEFAIDEAVNTNGNTVEFYNGASYVIFGQGNDFPAELNVTELNGSNGFTVLASDSAPDDPQRGDRLGRSVSGAGDINGDGLADVIIGAPSAEAVDQYGRLDQFAGNAYVVFGSREGFPAALSVDDLDGSNGFTIEGYGPGVTMTGESVSDAGDVNGDGLDDVIIGAPDAGGGFAGGERAAGEAYVVFGQPEFAAVVETFNLGGDTGFVVRGTSSNDEVGAAVGGDGDVNGDGLDDVIIGNPADESSAAYVVFGGFSTDSFAPTVVGALSLIDATTDQAVGTLEDGDVLDVSNFGSEGFDVNVLTQNPTTAQVRFVLEQPDGSVLERTEQSAPYVLFGHRGADFNGMAAVPGDYTLTVSTFSGEGAPGTTTTVGFSITDTDEVNVLVFPNRFDNELTIQTDRPVDDMQLQLQSVTNGRTHVVTPDLLSWEAKGWHVDTRSLPADHYILQLTDAQQTHTLHVVKK